MSDGQLLVRLGLPGVGIGGEGPAPVADRLPGEADGPKDAPLWIAETLVRDGYELGKAAGHRHAHAVELLGLGADPAWAPFPGRPHPVAEAVEQATPARATVIALGLLLAAIEGATGRHTGRFDWAWRPASRR